MSPRFRPMLAGQAPLSLDKIRYPVLATPKIDGIRCVTMDSWRMPTGWKCLPVTRHLKEVPNRWLRDFIGTTCPPLLDGELKCGRTFQDCGAIMQHEGIPKVKYYIFDHITPDREDERGLMVRATYEERVATLMSLMEGGMLPEMAEVLIPIRCETHPQLISAMAMHLEQGYEGTCIRTPDSPYKFGRSTLNEQYLLKIKTFVDSEAEIVGFNELVRNENKAEQNELHYQVRSSKWEGMRHGNTLGSLICLDERFGSTTFAVGTGFDADLRAEIWSRREEYLGCTIKYRYQPAGSKDRPRIPTFLGFRYPGDL